MLEAVHVCILTCKQLYLCTGFRLSTEPLESTNIYTHCPVTLRQDAGLAHDATWHHERRLAQLSPSASSSHASNPCLAPAQSAPRMSSPPRYSWHATSLRCDETLGRRLNSADLLLVALAGFPALFRTHATTVTPTAIVEEGEEKAHARDPDVPGPIHEEA